MVVTVDRWVMVTVVCQEKVGGQKWAVFGLKTGQRRDVTEKNYANVETFGAMSRCSRECY